MASNRLHRVCSVANCGKPHYGLGLCKSHYERQRIRGTLAPDKTPEGEPHRYFREVVLPFAGDECLLWPFGKKPYGYLKIDGRNYFVHRLACEAVNGPPPTPKHEAAHNCGNSRCCNPRHQRWATHLENMLDRIDHGTLARGEQHPRAKITRADVLLIRSLHGKKTVEELCKQFGVSGTHIRAVQKKRVWKWL